MFYYIICTLILVQWVKRDSGRIIALVDGFTYYIQDQNDERTRCRCTKAGYCKATFTIRNIDSKILRYNFTHNHEPPNFIIRNGVIMKV